MFLLLLPFLFNPVGLLLRWLPAIYLLTWPIIIQTMGRDTLLTHSLVLILFILTCDLSRQAMLHLIGYDLMSLPLGMGMLLCLTTDKGMLILSLLKPVFGTALTLAEPTFLLIEVYIVSDMISSFNRWIGHYANIRDEDSTDISTWEPPLSRKALISRAFILVLSLASFAGSYILVQAAKDYFEDIPPNFNHAIAFLATLQLIALTTTIYKEDGIVSESAMIGLVASVPIFIAAWSFYHLKNKDAG